VLENAERDLTRRDEPFAEEDTVSPEGDVETSAMMLPTVNARSDSGEESGQTQADEEIGDS
jgi:hypothetical protein